MTKTTRLLLIFAAATLLVGLPSVLQAAAEKNCTDGIDNDGDGRIDCADTNCKRDPACPGGGGAGGGTVNLRIEYDFDGQVTTVNACAVDVVCDQGHCEFIKEVAPFSFTLPSSFKTLIEATEWRGTSLDADLCYPGLELNPATRIRFRHDFGQRWIATVSGIACDLTKAGTLDSCDRDYQFRFDAPCLPEDCDPIPSVVGDSSVYEGDLLAVWSEGPDQKKGVPCRCTMSNDPGCPSEVAEMNPGVSIPLMTVTLEVLPACP